MRLMVEQLTLSGPASLDRLKRVRGYKRFDVDSSTASSGDATAGSSADPVDANASSLMVNDIAATLLRCQDIAFLAIITVSSLQDNGHHTQSLSGSAMCAFSSHVGFQVLRLLPRGTTDGNPHDWECTMEPVRIGTAHALLYTSAAMVEALKPTMVIPADGSPATYQFTTADLNALAALLLEKVSRDPNLALTTVPKADRFPYKLNGTCSMLVSVY